MDNTQAIENKELKQIIVQLRQKLEHLQTNLTINFEKELNTVKAENQELKNTILILRQEIENLKSQDIKNIQAITAEKNQEILQLHNITIELRQTLDAIVKSNQQKEITLINSFQREKDHLINTVNQLRVALEGKYNGQK